VSRSRTLHTAYRVSDLDKSLAFYSALAYEVIGKVELGDESTLTMLSFPG
jgi:lactoylglutathione lyase